ncbi:hypothetical protein EJB05_09188, partial [Eragrostis curvula]
MTFSISDETFGSLPPPPWFEDTSSVITELDGCLCLCYEESESEDVIYHVCVLRDYKGVRWETLCRIDQTTWSEPERALLDSYWIAPLCMYHSDRRPKIMFGTGDCKVFVAELDGSAPHILFTPDDTIIGSCDDDDVPSIGLFDESLVPVGSTIEDMISASPTAKMWFHVLKWLPTRSVLELSLVCREWHAMVTTDRFVQSHVIHANLDKSPRIMIIVDPRFAPYVDLKEFVDGRRPPLHCNIVSQKKRFLTRRGSTLHCTAIGYRKHIEFDDHDGTFFAGRIGLGFDSETDMHVLVHITYKMAALETIYSTVGNPDYGGKLCPIICHESLICPLD